jgi:Tol biopolymer transport system component
LLATDVDLLVPPVWSPDAESIVVRKNTPEEGSRGTFELILLGRDGERRTLTTWRSAAAFPIGFSPDGATLYFATLNERGTDVYRIGADGSGEALVAHLSDGIARDWRLSPDGTTLAYSVAETRPSTAIFAMTLDLATAVAERVTAEGGGAELNPAWRGDDVTISLADVEGGSSVTVDVGGVNSTLAESDDSIDLPLAWAPDGSALAVRAVDGSLGDGIGSSYVELIGADGSRQRASDSPDALVVGWMP